MLFVTINLLFSFITSSLLQLKIGNSEDCVPRNGRWNYNNKVVHFFFLKIPCHCKFVIYITIDSHPDFVILAEIIVTNTNR